MKKDFPKIPAPRWTYLKSTQDTFPRHLGRRRKTTVTVPFDGNSEISGFKSMLIPYIDEEIDALGNFIEVIKAYCTSIGKGLGYTSIMEYWGILGPAQTLQKLGDKNQVTRERIRQLRNIHVNKIRKLLKGSIINSLRCDSIVLKSIHDLRDAFLEHHFLLDEHIDKILKFQNISLTEDRKSHLLLFFTVFNIEINLKIRTPIVIYCTRRLENISILKGHYRNIKKYFLNNIQSISLTELSKKFNIPYSLVKSFIFIMPNIEKIEEDKYQIKNSEISSAMVAERVLQLTKRPIDRNELLDVVNDLRGKDVNKIYYFKEKKIKNIGLTGLLDLKDSSANKDYIYGLVKKALTHYHKSCSKDKIYEYISRIRPDINQIQVNTNIARHINIHFLRLNNGEIILKRWKNTYKSELYGKYHKHTKPIQGKFNKLLIDILKDKKLSCKEISSGIAKISDYEENYCNMGIYQSRILNIDKSQKRWIFSLKENYKEIVNSLINRTRYRVITDILDLFKKEGKNELLRTYIVEHIADVSIPQIYKLLRDKNIFSVEVVSKKCSLVRLNPGYCHGQ